MSNSTIVNSKANLYITKPFDIVQLAEKLKGMLGAQTRVNMSETYLDFILQYVPLYGFKAVRLLRM